MVDRTLPGVDIRVLHKLNPLTDHGCACAGDGSGRCSLPATMREAVD